MKAVLVTSRKGGCGKSTLTANLAVGLQSLGKKTAILDLDPQKSLKFWSQLRGDAPPPVHAVSNSDWLLEAQELEDEGIDVLLIDSPPIDKPWIRRLMLQVELILIPTRPTPLDIYSGTFSDEWANASPAPKRWVINAAHSGSVVQQAIREELEKFTKVMGTVIHQRTDIALSMGEGQSVSEYAPGSRSAQEFEALSAEVYKILYSKSRKKLFVGV